MPRRVIIGIIKLFMPREAHVKKLQKRPRETSEEQDGTKENESTKVLTLNAASEEKSTTVVHSEMVTSNRATSLLAKWPGNAPRAFWEAMKEGDSTEVAMAIVKDPSYGLDKEARNLKDIDDLSFCYRKFPLNLALWAKRPDIVSALIDAGANPNYGAFYVEHRSLSEACKLGDLESCKALITAGATLNKGMLYDAAAGGNAAIIKLLAAKGLSVKGIHSGSSQSPIHTAAEQGHTAAVEAILDLGEDVDVLARGEDYIDSALTLAAENGHIETVKLLVARGTNINLRPCGDTALDKAVQRDNVAMVKTLLALGADPKDDKGFQYDFRGDGNSVYSCNNVKSVKVAKLLTSHGAVIKLAYLNNEQVPEPVLEYYFQQLMLSKRR